MKNLLNPKNLFAIHTLPLVVFAVLIFNRFSVINTLLNEESIKLWRLSALLLGLLTVLNAGYAVFASMKKKNLGIAYALSSLAVHVVFLYWYYWNIEKLFPASVPVWMYSQGAVLHAGSFFMPFILYLLFILAVSLSSRNSKYSPVINFFAAAAIPFFAYLFITIILPLVHENLLDSSFFQHVFIVLFISITLAFLFFVIKTIYLLLTKTSESNSAFSKKECDESKNLTPAEAENSKITLFVSAFPKYFCKILFAGLLPILGLLVNNLFGNVFGDFSHPAFFLLAVLNCIFICLPVSENKAYRLFLFAARTGTILFSLYFFLVFIPFVPFSILLIIAAGAGFLMLTPLVLFIIHIHEFFSDLNFLKRHFPKYIVFSLLFISLIPIPSAITVSCLHHRKTLHQALSYVYAPDYKKEYQINLKQLERTLKEIKQNKQRGDFLFSDGYIPFLSAYFNYLVLDNLTLSDSKIDKLEKIFFGKTSVKTEASPDSISKVKLSNVRINGNYYDEVSKVWKTHIEFELKNLGGNNEEYRTKIKLPDGVFISDYYLYIGDKKEAGILTEKNAALWVFSQIKNEKRDPGLIFYTSENEIELKVFPFAENEVRKTGIELLHCDSVLLDIDGHTIILGDERPAITEPVKTRGGGYLSSYYKKTLKKIKRSPYFHFIIDTSKNGAGKFNKFNTYIKRLSEIYPALFKDAKISFTNTYVHTVPFTPNWYEEYGLQNFEGGFFAERAIRSALIQAYRDSSSKKRPIFVIVADEFIDEFITESGNTPKNTEAEALEENVSNKKTQAQSNWILGEDFSDIRFTFPESDLFFVLNENGMHAHSLTKDPNTEIINTETEYEFEKEVLEYTENGGKPIFISDNGEPSFVLTAEDFSEAEDSYLAEEVSSNKNWFEGAALFASNRLLTLNPEAVNTKRLAIIRKSFASKILCHFTAYMVVENEAQKAALLEKQKDMLSGNPFLDAGGNEPSSMSEPSILLTLCIFLVIIIIAKRSVCLVLHNQ